MRCRLGLVDLHEPTAVQQREAAIHGDEAEPSALGDDKPNLSVG
jgi:hypothetical protein